MQVAVARINQRVVVGASRCSKVARALMGAALLWATLGVGCAPRPGLEPAPPGEQLRLAQQNVLTAGVLSAGTVSVLEIEGLLPRASEQNVVELRALVRVRPNAERLLALAEVSFLLAERPGESPQAAWMYLAEASLATWTAMFGPDAQGTISRHGPQWLLAQSLHNTSLARVVGMLPALPGTEEAEVRCAIPGGELRVAYEWKASHWSPGPFVAFLPANDFRVLGMRNRNRQFGFGAPLLGERALQNPLHAPPAEHHLPPGYQTVALTVVMCDVQFHDGVLWPPQSCRLEMMDPSTTRTAWIAGREVPIEADFTAALAHTLARDRPIRRAGFGGLRNAEKWESFAGLYMLEPFDPKRIPVVFVHGLVSSPLVWREMINDLWRDPIVRERFQFWFFLYPTGNPVAVSAAHLRTDLQAVRDLHDPDRREPALDEMVLIGHSMGGIVSRLLVTDAGDALWRAVSDVSIEEATIGDAEDRELLQRTLFVTPDPAVRRVVFIAVPHRGSAMADMTISRLFARLIRLPPTLVESARRIVEQNPDAIRPSLDRNWAVATGIDSLSPGSPFLRALSELPIAPGVTTHSIIGQRSGGDAQRGTDGVVPFTSSHLPSAQSELIIPDSNHSVPDRPAATREVHRILREHATHPLPAEAAKQAPPRAE